MSGNDRNRPCWCGSGRKYKKCHLGRESQMPIQEWEARKAILRQSQTALCLHPSASSSTCSSKIIKAHTVRRSADLKTIARRGHVYHSDVSSERDSGMELELIGVNRASTFLGFCSKHDASTFAPIEVADLRPTSEQAFLLAYRPLCKELYAKERQLESMIVIRDSDKGRPVEAQVSTQQFANDLEAGIKLGISDLRHHKQKYDDDLLAGDFQHIRYVSIELDRTPDIMCSSALQPEFTFDGHLIQDLSDVSRELDYISFTLASVPAGGVAVFAWRSDSDVSCSKLCDSLLRIPRAAIPNALVRYVLSNIENAYFRPEWIESLPKPLRKELLRRAQENVGPEDQVELGYLADDGNSWVAWSVKEITQKRY